MTPEQTIELALQAGMQKLPGKWDGWSCHLDELQRFAVLVRNETLEEAAKAVDKMANDKKATQQQQFALDLASDLIRSLK